MSEEMELKTVEKIRKRYKESQYVALDEADAREFRNYCGYLLTLQAELMDLREERNAQEELIIDISMDCCVLVRLTGYGNCGEERLLLAPYCAICKAREYLARAALSEELDAIRPETNFEPQAEQEAQDE